MTGFFDRFKKSGGRDYNLWRLVDSSFVSSGHDLGGKSHIFCDIDKTYIETEFDTVFQMARMAFQAPEEKVTVLGASTFLQLLRWGDVAQSYESDKDYPRALHFVSSSPPQLREKLETKFTLDKLDWTSDTFKNQAYNLRKGRFDLLRQQITYKTAAILSILERSRVHSAELFLIGDSSESDTFIYLGIKLFLEKKINSETFTRYLKVLGVPSGEAEAMIDKFGHLQGRVKGIFIRQVPDRPVPLFAELSKHIFTFDNFLQPALAILHMGAVPCECLEAIVKDFHNKHQMPLVKIATTLTRFKNQLQLDSQLLSAVDRCLNELNQQVEQDDETDSTFRNGFEAAENTSFDQVDELAARWLLEIQKFKENQKG